MCEYSSTIRCSGQQRLRMTSPQGTGTAIPPEADSRLYDGGSGALQQVGAALGGSGAGLLASPGFYGGVVATE